jgi:hypothetical protein
MRSVRVAAATAPRPLQCSASRGGVAAIFIISFRPGGRARGKPSTQTIPALRSTGVLPGFFVSLRSTALDCRQGEKSRGVCAAGRPAAFSVLVRRGASCISILAIVRVLVVQKSLIYKSSRFWKKAVAMVSSW